MQLINMRKNAEAMANEQIRDAVLTVPPYFDQAQRLALIDAANLAGLRPLGLINDGLAVALDYAKARMFDVPQIHIIFDMGAGSTSATIVRFSTNTVKDIGRFNKTVTNIDVLGIGYSLQACGNAMTEKLYNYLLAEFDNGRRTATSISTNSRATARLLKEATRIKQVLSANNEAVVSLESLHEDVDFRHKVTRSLFEELTQGLGSLSTKTIQDALGTAKIAISDVQSLILHGGAARVPFVQKALLEILPEEKIARNVNADEAAVMGAVFRGAGLSGSFRVKELIPQDISMYSYSYKTTHAETELFPVATPFGSSKNLTFSAPNEDFTVSFTYERSDKVPQVVTDLSVSGVSNATSSLSKEYGCPAPEVLLTVSLDNSGLVKVLDAFAHCEAQEKQGVADKLKGWFGAKESTTAPANPDLNAGASEEPVVKTVFKRASLNTGAKSGSVQYLGEEETQQSLQKIKVYERHDSDRVARETARNGLEAYIYKVRDFLESDTFQDVSTVAQQQELRQVSAVANDWMYEEGETATLTDFVAKKKELTSLTGPILSRRNELNVRKSKVDALQKHLASSRDFIKNQTSLIKAYDSRQAELSTSAAAKIPSADKADDLTDDDASSDKKEPRSKVLPEATENDLAEPIYNEDDLSSLKSKLDAVQDWLTATVSEQEQLPKTDNPVLLSSDLESKGKEITDEFMSVLQKASYRQQLKARAKATETLAKAKAKAKATKAAKKSSTKPKDAPAQPEDIKSESESVPVEADAADPAPLPEAQVDTAGSEGAAQPPEPESTPIPRDRDEL